MDNILQLQSHIFLPSSRCDGAKGRFVCIAHGLKHTWAKGGNWRGENAFESQKKIPFLYSLGAKFSICDGKLPFVPSTHQTQPPPPLSLKVIIYFSPSLRPCMVQIAPFLRPQWRPPPATAAAAVGGGLSWETMMTVLVLFLREGGKKGRFSKTRRRMQRSRRLQKGTSRNRRIITNSRQKTDPKKYTDF